MYTNIIAIDMYYTSSTEGVIQESNQIKYICGMHLSNEPGGTGNSGSVMNWANWVVGHKYLDTRCDPSYKKVISRSVRYMQ